MKILTANEVLLKLFVSTCEICTAINIALNEHPNLGPFSSLDVRVFFTFLRHAHSPNKDPQNPITIWETLVAQRGNEAIKTLFQKYMAVIDQARLITGLSTIVPTIIDKMYSETDFLCAGCERELPITKRNPVIPSVCSDCVKG